MRTIIIPRVKWIKWERSEERKKSFYINLLTGNGRTHRNGDHIRPESPLRVSRRGSSPEVIPVRFDSLISISVNDSERAEVLNKINDLSAKKV